VLFRFEMLLAATAFVAATCAPVYADTGPARRIGVLTTDTPRDHAPFAAAFRKGLAEGGYLEGKNVVVERRFALEGLPSIQAQLVDLLSLRVEVLVTDSTPQALAAREATRTLPIVTISGDPVAAGLVNSLGHPGGNITAVSTLGPGPAGKRLALLKELSPGIRRVGMFWVPDNPSSRSQVDETRAAATQLDVALQLIPLRRRDDIEQALASLTSVDAIIIAEDPLLDAVRPQIGKHAAHTRMPVVCNYRTPADESCLLWYGPDLIILYRRLGAYTARVLSGTKPADLPVEQPSIFSLVVNARAAKHMGITIPSSILEIAEEIIR
jgi:putative tryptophan/tyrosine transport system substrate-binding protein